MGKKDLNDNVYNSNDLGFGEYNYTYNAEFEYGNVYTIRGIRNGILLNLGHGYVDLITNHFINNDDIIGNVRQFKVKNVVLPINKICSIFQQLEANSNYLASEWLVDENGNEIDSSLINFKASTYFYGYKKVNPNLFVLSKKNSLVKKTLNKFKKKTS